jgi:DNA-binding transcriptional ArsR family regulator
LNGKLKLWIGPRQVFDTRPRFWYDRTYVPVGGFEGKVGGSTMGKQRCNHRDRILNYLEAYLDENGYPPTYDEIREAVGLSSRSHVNYHLTALEEQGFIERTPRVPRGLRLVDSAAASLQVEGASSTASGSG